MFYHPQQSVLNPHPGQRQTACIRYISALHRSHSVLTSPAGAVFRADFSGVIGRATGRGESASDMREIMARPRRNTCVLRPSRKLPHGRHLAADHEVRSTAVMYE